MRADARELAEWEAYYSLEPFGEERMDYRFALIAMMLAQFGGVKNPKIEDYVLFPVAGRRAQTMDDMAKQARLLASWFRGNRSKPQSSPEP